MKLSEELKARGFINHFSGESLEVILDGEPRTFYLGTDPTATSLTIGNVAAYMLARHLVDAGFKPILLLGGATGMIGDPGGKDAERTLLSEETLARNIAGIRAQIETVLGVSGVTIVNNADWLAPFNLLDFLREVGKHFTVNAMIKKDIVKNRLDQENPISYTEFSYSLLQGYDFYHLAQTHNCTLQIGGSDQWSNILAGVEYTKKKSGDEVFGLTIPIIVNPATGKKFGKSEEGALWLDKERTSPYKLYQYLLNVDDVGVEDLLKIYTLLPLKTIASLLKEHSESPHNRKAQKTLAFEVVQFLHGTAAAELAQNVSTVLFGGKDVTELAHEEIEILLHEAPSLEIKEGITITEVLLQAELVSSRSEAKKLIEAGGVSVSDVKVLDPNYMFESDDFSRGVALLRKGKKSLIVLTLA